jgi:hypothetical protein
VNDELPAELGGVGGPLGRVERVGGVARAGEEEEGGPVGERVWAVLFESTPGEGDAFLDEASEGGNSLRERKEERRI